MERLLQHYPRLAGLLHKGHDAIIVGSLLYAAIAFAVQTKWILPAEGFHIGWHEWAGISIFLLSSALKLGVSWQANKFRNGQVTKGSRVLDAMPPNISFIDADDEHFLHLGALANRAYPPKYKSTLTGDDRTETFARWQRDQPGSVKVLIEKGPFGETIIGFSIMARTKKQTYREYRNGYGKALDWVKDNFDLDFSDQGQFLFVYYVYCLHSVPGSADVVNTMFVEHVASMCKSPRNWPPVIFDAVNTKEGKANALGWGFEQSRISRVGMPIFELDCRRVQDLSDAAKATYRSICDVALRNAANLVCRRITTSDEIAEAQALRLRVWSAYTDPELPPLPRVEFDRRLRFSSFPLRSLRWSHAGCVRKAHVL
ncbi:MAG: hypothetical protein JST30_13515 [Armatimonadetes bacterium]|nr:hypothetical protein [Armatimonadota bacterium]